LNEQGIKLLLLLALLATGHAVAFAGEQTVRQQCVQCHDIEGPAPSALEALWTRKGPDLFYAGNKYKREWLESWLQEPARIRPAGMFFANHVEHDGTRDALKVDSLPDHPALDVGTAASVADFLMTLKANTHLIKEGEYRPGTIALSMGELLFDRFRGCLGCHEIEPGYGGLSGPEVYTAAARLQEDYLISFIRDPQAWDPVSIMPARKLSDNDLQRLVHYLRALNEEVAQ
jgi:mono/diheme cytochrome c family protein